MKKIIIIGGGIAGLSAGVFARLHGFDTTIYEMHSLPGGECTGWNREGYHFDNCIHWLTGTKPDTDLYKVWETVGAFKNTTIYTADYFTAYAKGGQTVYFYKDLVKLKEHLLRVAPEDKAMIEEFVSGIEAAKGILIYTKKPWGSMNILDMFGQMKVYMPLLKKIKKWSKISVAEYVEQFKSSILKEAIASLLYSECSLMNVMFMLGIFSSGNGGWPMEGSLAMAKRMAARYEEVGGKICYKAKVKAVMIEDGTAVGIRLATGEAVLADHVISTIDGMMLLKELLGNRVSDKKLECYETKSEDYVFPLTVDVGLGIKADLSHRPHQCSYQVEPFQCGEMVVDAIGIKHYCIEKGFAPESCSVVRIGIAIQNTTYWQDLKKQDPTAYRKAKEDIGMEIIERVEKIYPETKDLIEVVDICTPATYERYCNAYRGCWMTPLPKVGTKNIQHSGKLTGIKNLHVAGQWIVSIGGLPTAVLSGKWAVQNVCKQEKVKFKMPF